MSNVCSTMPSSEKESPLCGLNCVSSCVFSFCYSHHHSHCYTDPLTSHTLCRGKSSSLALPGYNETIAEFQKTFLCNKKEQKRINTKFQEATNNPVYIIQETSYLHASELDSDVVASNSKNSIKIYEFIHLCKRRL